MKKTFSLFVSGTLVATAALVASFALDIQRDTAPEAEAATRKITICHRTRAVTNPYRRITVSPNSITKSRGHGDHLGGVFNATPNYYDSNAKNWGDIIPGGDSDGTPYNGANNIDLNWDAAGKAIFLPTGANASKCNRMTAKQFYDYQLAAGVPQADIITELNEMEANEDKALLASLPGGVFTTSNVSTWATAIAVTTNAATSVTDGTGSNGSAVLNGSLKFSNGSAVRWYFELWKSDNVSTLIRTTETKTYATANSLTADGTVQTLTGVSVTALDAGTYYFRVVGITDYDTDTEGILYGETKSFGIAVPVITTETLADGVVGTPYSETINATGGTGAKTNFRLNSGSLPGGLSITNPGTPDSTAALAGTPTTKGLYTLPLKVDDSASGTPNTSAVKELTLRIREAQTITIPDPGSKSYGDAPFAANISSNVTADEIGDLGSFTSYSSSTPSVCSISSSGQVTLTGAGSCTISATHSGNGYWLTKTESRTFTVGTKAITIKAANKSKVVNGTDPTPSYTLTVGSLVGSDSISSVTYGYSGNGHTPPTSIPNVAGTFTITPSAATMTGGRESNYTISYDTGVLTVSATAAAQTIDFADPADKTYGDAPFVITATSKDGSINTDLEIVFTSQTPSVCTVGTESISSGVTSVTVTALSAGVCTIEASQPGGSNGSTTYAAATPVTQSLTIDPKPLVITAADKSKTVGGTNPTFTFTVSGLVGSDDVGSVTFTFSSSSYTASTTVPNVVGSFAIAPSAAVFSRGVAGNYVVSYVNGVLTVSAASVAPTTTGAPVSAVSVPATTTTIAGRPTDPRKTTTDPFANIKVEPKSTKGGGGTLTIDGDPAMDVLGVTTDDPTIEVEVTKTGVEYNKPATWVAEGFGDECWKIEPGGGSYTLPAVPQNPSGKAGLYSLVKVKAGSLTSTDPNFQVNTLFVDPKPGDVVWPDSNKNGVLDSGGKNGDKEISHVILCVRYTDATGNTSTTSTVPTAATTPGGSVTTTPGGSTTTAPGGSTTTTPGGSTTTTPGGPSTTLPKDAPDTDGERDNIVVRIRAVAGVTRVSKSAAVTLRLSSAFEERTVELTVNPQTMEVKQVEALGEPESVEAFVAATAANARARAATRSLPATGQQSGAPVQWALLMLLGGAVIAVLPRVRRRSKPRA